MVDHRLLDRMQLSSAREILDGDELPAVGLAGEQDAGIDRLVDEPLAAQPPSTTVQAPQSPSAQPSLVPVARSVRRR